MFIYKTLEKHQSFQMLQALTARSKSFKVGPWEWNLSADKSCFLPWKL